MMRRNWSFHLVVLFFNALRVSLKSLLSLGLQVASLEWLEHRCESTPWVRGVAGSNCDNTARLRWEEATYRDDGIFSLSPRRQPRHNSHFLSPRHSLPVPASLLHYGSGSIAEQMIVSYQPGGNLKPVVTKADGYQYPKKTDNGYVSRHLTTFRGCLGCGQLGYLFKDCLQNKNLEVRANYWQELWCQIPASRKNNTTMRDDWMSRSNNNNASVMHVAPQQSTSGPLGRVGC